ncbi:MetQ/NlpA family ABC transporter substrate-binding protein [Aedoeadaptatus coxii]|uniref:MetQ/NlpA family ABC transporter substrate-binding protein n=1 Tax=Aedoeadaptatus coxii TaxID=755172 RepID=UPI002AD3C237|nr:MetQ/NlpA family ABC transporter substrate-binding protein [Peptoniphilus coxii]
MKGKKIKIATMEEFYFKDVVMAAKENLAKDGIDVEIVTFADNVTPNTATMEGSVDYNFFEHVPFLNDFNASKQGGDLAVVGKPITAAYEGLHSNTYKSLDDIKDGARVGIPNDASNRTMHLKFLDKLGLIKLKDNKAETVDLTDVAENPHHFKFIEMDTPSIVSSLDDLDLGTCSQSSIVKRGIDPKTALATYNDPLLGIVLVTKKENVDSELSKRVYEAFTSQEVLDMIAKKYDNVVEPLFENDK